MKRKTVLPLQSRQERHKATSIGQHLSRNASTHVSILKFTEKKLFLVQRPKFKIFEKRINQHTHFLDFVCQHPALTQLSGLANNFSFPINFFLEKFKFKLFSAHNNCNCVVRVQNIFSKILILAFQQKKNKIIFSCKFEYRDMG